MKKMVLFFILAVTAAGCQQSDSEIVADRQWKADSNNLLGDFVTFSKVKDSGLYISNDTIYYDGMPKALLISTSYNVDHYIMTVNSMDHKTAATYVDKGRAK